MRPGWAAYRRVASAPSRPRMPPAPLPLRDRSRRTGRRASRGRGPTHPERPRRAARLSLHDWTDLNGAAHAGRRNTRGKGRRLVEVVRLEHADDRLELVFGKVTDFRRGVVQQRVLHVSLLARWLYTLRRTGRPRGDSPLRSPGRAWVLEGRRENSERRGRERGHGDTVGTGRSAGLAREGCGWNSGADGTASTVGCRPGAGCARGCLLRALGAVHRQDSRGRDQGDARALSGRPSLIPPDRRRAEAWPAGDRPTRRPR